MKPYETDFFLTPLQIDLLKKINVYNSDILILAKDIELIRNEMIRLYSDKTHPHNSHWAGFYRDIISCLCWYTDEGIIATDALGQYILELKNQQYEIVNNKYPNMASMTPRAALVLIDFNAVFYNFNGKHGSFINFARSNYSISDIPKTALYPQGCMCLHGFSFYGFPRFTNLVFKDMIFNCCFVINSYFSFYFDNCKLSGWKFLNSRVNIDRKLPTNKQYNKFYFLGTSKIEHLDIVENIDSDHEGMGFEVTEPNYLILIKEAWFCLLYRYKPFKELGKLMTIKKMRFFRVLHTGYQVVPMYNGRLELPYTNFDESFNPDINLPSNSKFINYIDWYKIHSSKVRRIYNSDSSFLAIMAFLDILITGSWKSLKYIFLSTIFVVLGFALTFLLMKDSYNSIHDIGDALYYSVRHFFNVGSGDINAETTIPKFITAIEGFLGYFFLALIIYHVTKDSDRKN